MDSEKIADFAQEYLALYLDPGTTSDAVTEGFAERCTELGLVVDEGQGLQDEFPDFSPFQRTEDMETVAGQITDAHMLGCAILSRWYFVTRFDRDGLLQDQHRRWFVAAFSQLAYLTRDPEDTQIIVLPEIAKLQESVDQLREKLADLLARREELVYVIVPALASEYRVTLGTMEYEVFRGECAVRRVKREIELVRAQLSQHKLVDLNAIRAQLDEEFEVYTERMHNQLHALRRAVQFHNTEKLSLEDTKRLKTLYHSIMRRLHPDLNPHGTERQLTLFQQARVAYEQGDLPSMEALYAVYEAPGLGQIERTARGLGTLREEKVRLERCLKEETDRINDILTSFPCTERALLANEELVQRRRKELTRTITHLKETEARYKRKLEEILAAGPS